MDMFGGFLKTLFALLASVSIMHVMTGCSNESSNGPVYLDCAITTDSVANGGDTIKEGQVQNISIDMYLEKGKASLNGDFYTVDNPDKNMVLSIEEKEVRLGPLFLETDGSSLTINRDTMQARYTWKVGFTFVAGQGPCKKVEERKKAAGF